MSTKAKSNLSSVRKSQPLLLLQDLDTYRKETDTIPLKNTISPNKNKDTINKFITSESVISDLTKSLESIKGQ